MSNQSELAVANGGEMQQPDPILVMIQSAARDPDADVDKMERLMSMYERQCDKQAQAAFNKALSAVQSQTGRISADAKNPQTGSRYATYAALDRVLRPIYTKHGLSLSFDTGDTDKSETVRVVCHVSHESGHTRTYHVDMPADGKGAKGNAMMTSTHATGSAMSYGMRYLLKLIFNVAIGEDDDDGNTASVEVIDAKQVAEIDALIDELGSRVNKTAFSEYLRTSLKVPNGNVEKLPKKAYKTVIDMLERKRQS